MEANVDGAVGKAEVAAEDGAAKVEGVADGAAEKAEVVAEDSAAKAETAAGDSAVEKVSENLPEKVEGRTAELTEEDIEKFLIDEIGEENAKIAMKPLA